MHHRILPTSCAVAFAVLVGGAVAPRPAPGQAADSAAAAEADTAASTRDTTEAIPLAPLRVHVRRAPLSLNRVPYAVTVEGAGPSDGPGLTLGEAIRAAPGIQVDNRYSFSQGDRIAIRGFGSRTQFGVRGVKVLVDGIPATLPDGQTSLSHLDPATVTRAEVLRGPASSLWGNAAGGMIRIETAPAPGRGRASGAAAQDGATAGARALAGAHGLVRRGGEAGWTSGRFAVGAAVTAFSWDGFRAHTDADRLFGTLRADWGLGRDTLAFVAHVVDYEAANAGALTAEQLAEDPSQANPVNVTQRTGEQASQGQAGLTWTRAVGERRLQLSGWALTREVDNPIPPAIIDLSRRAAGLRGTLRSTTSVGGRAISWTAGLDAEGQWDDRRNFENEAGERGALTLDQAERVLVVAPFVELSGPVARTLHATLGLRWDRYRFEADDRLTGPGNPDFSGSRALGALSPSAGLVVALGAVDLYGNLSTAFETPTTSELANRPSGEGGFNPDLDPQRALSMEAGARARLGGGALAQLAVYRTTIDDALIPFEVPEAPGRSFFRNAGEATHRGVELDVWTAPVPGVTLRTGWAWTDARFTDFTTEDGEFSGNRVPGVSPHRLTGSLAWRPRPGGRLEVSARRVGAVPVDDGNTAEAPVYAIVDLRASARAAGGALELYGGVDNLFAAEHVTAVVVNAFGGRFYEPGPGRSAYVGARVTLP